MMSKPSHGKQTTAGKGLDMKKISMLLFAALTLSLIPSTTAFAQGDNEVEGGGAVLLPVSEIRGKRQAPGAVYILKNKDLSYERVDLDKSFVDRIEETVEQDPF